MRAENSSLPEEWVLPRSCSKNTPGERCSCETMTRSVPLITKEPVVELDPALAAVRAVVAHRVEGPAARVVAHELAGDVVQDHADLAGLAQLVAGAEVEQPLRRDPAAVAAAAAVGVKAALELKDANRPVVCLATAHPAKFGAAVAQAIGSEPPLPPALSELASRESRCAVLDADINAIKDFVAANALR